jgi:ZIP family zinc transporter
MGLALGGAVNLAFLVAVFISNLPEGVAGTVNLEVVGYSRRTIAGLWTIVVVLSAACAGIGFGLVHWLPEVDGLVIQAFAAGAMLTMLADAMMPEAFEHGGKLAGLFTVAGFLVAAVLSAM